MGLGHGTAAINVSGEAISVLGFFPFLAHRPKAEGHGEIPQA
jgi:hypothetical protein